MNGQMNNEWKKFTDEIPEVQRHLWVWANGQHISRWFFLPEDIGNLSLCQFTHWCYCIVPEPPKEEGLKEIEKIKVPLKSFSGAFCDVKFNDLSEVLVKFNELVERVNILTDLVQQQGKQQ